ncbi:MAG: hypothetical protein M3134_08450 [Actinomycetota bacterium]|nr:hypothetical protein [Actinomycetota bacterium]
MSGGLRIAAIAAALLLGACVGGASPGVTDALADVADAHDAYHEEHGTYPDPLGGEDWGVGQDLLEEWNVIVYYAEDGYCIEADDEHGETWHVTRDARQPEQGECPDP